MRHALLALTFSLLPLASHAATPTEPAHAHGSLGAHEHGTARLDVALEGPTLALDLDSPGMNLVGFEHAPGSDADNAAVAKARALLAAPGTLFALPAAAQCSLARLALVSPLFGDTVAQPADHEHDEDADDDGDHHQHSDVDGHFQFHCEHPEALTGLDLAQFFKAFPATHKVLVQAITGNGQAGVEATPDNSKLAF